jgi:hypothetical protein
MPNEEKHTLSQRWLSDGLVIAFSPILASLFAFVYESGYASYFNIPQSFISISLTSVFVVAGALLAIFMMLFGLTSLVLSCFPPVLTPIHRRILCVLPVLLLCIGFVVLFDRWQDWIVYAAPCIVMVAYLFLVPLLGRRSVPTYSAKLAAQLQSESRVSFYDTLFHDKRAGLIVGLIIFGLLLTNAAGKAAAMKQRQFLVIAGKPEIVVLRVYGDNLICAPLLRDSKQIVSEFSILKEQDPTLRLRLENVGPLRLTQNP